MGRIKDFPPSFGKTCSVCANECAVAYWQGAEDIRICYWCAIDILPKLIGDAVVEQGHKSVNESWKHAKGEFYYACALALERKHNEKGSQS